MDKESWEQHNQPVLHEFGKLGKSFFFPLGTSLQIEVEGIATRLISLAVGDLPGECLIIRYPHASGIGPISHKLFKGSRITVRFLAGGNALAFNSEVLGIIQDPFSLLLISYPDVIARHNLRNNRRMQCYLAAHLSIALPRSSSNNTESLRSTEETFYEGIITDISKGGCNFEMIEGLSNSELPDAKIDGMVVLLFELPGMEHKRELSGLVKSVRRDSRRMSVGVQFGLLDEETRYGIDEYVSALERFLLEK
jgi:c-di-GMP-binding flagellar brake protein YcgR